MLWRKLLCDAFVDCCCCFDSAWFHLETQLSTRKKRPLLLWRKVSKKIRMSSSAIPRNSCGTVPIYFMVEFAEGSWYTDYQNPVSARIETERPSSAPHDRWMGLNRDGHQSRFSQKILFSEEDHSWLSGYVNKQNFRIWSDDNPQSITSSKILCLVCSMDRGNHLFISRRIRTRIHFQT